MSDLFLKIINMSISASWLVLAVLLLRFALKKAPKWVNVLLWGIVAVRLAFPFSIESALSLIPSAETVPMDIEMAVQPTINSGVPVINSMVNPMLSSFAPPQDVLTSANPLQIWIPILSVVWVVGVVTLLLYTVVSYWRLRRKVSEAVILRDNIFQSENVASPFVLGLFRPRIYLPYNMDGQDLSHVVAHEQAHIRRRDHWWKPLGFLLLTIHWFNPLMWLAYVLLCRDIELACDEKVIKELGNEQRADYTQALVACSVNRRMIAACPLAFGEVGVKERVKSVMNYKKPAFWVVVLAVIACVIVAVCFLTNPKQDSYTLRIVVPAGSTEEIVYQEDFAYSDEEISPTGNKITISSGEGLGDTEVVLKPIEVKEENAYEPTYLTPGMPIEMDVEKGAWFKVGVNIQNPADKDIIVYVKVEGVKVRISDEIIPNSITFEAEVLEVRDGYFLVKPEPSWAINSADQIEVPMKNMDPALEPQVGDTIEIVCSGEILETYPARLSKVYGIKVAAETSKLSLNDVIMLSQYGYDLSWSDFDDFEYIETGSGLYIRVYEINEMYELWIGGSWIDEDPMYIYLALADDLDTRIDIRDGGVTEFIGTDHSEALLNRAIYDAIINCNRSEKTLGMYHCASFVMLDKEEISGTPVADSNDHVGTVTVYGLALHHGYDVVDGNLQEVEGSHTPVAITFNVKNGKYSLKEYWRPGDGAYYAPDIREKFPDEIEDDAMDTQKYILAQIQECRAQAVATNGIDTISTIEQLFEIIESSPATSSRPADYIDAHPIEYRELTYYGSYTLRYVFSKFLEGGQTGLRGHLMRSVLDNLAPEAQLRLYAETGQEYFDEWKAGAIRISEQHDMEWIEKHQPAIWLLLQMIDE